MQQMCELCPRDKRWRVLFNGDSMWKKSPEMWRVGGVIQKNVPNVQRETWQVMCDIGIFFFEMSTNHTIAIVLSIKLFWGSNPPVCVLFQLADSEVLPTACQTSLSLCVNITKCRLASLCACVLLCVCLCVCMCERVCFKLSVPLFIRPRVCSLPYFLLFASRLSVLSFPWLPFISAWIPKCKMAAERESESEVYIFNGALLYFNEPPFPPSSFGSVRTEEKETDRGEIYK